MGFAKANQIMTNLEVYEGAVWDTVFKVQVTTQSDCSLTGVLKTSSKNAPTSKINPDLCGYDYPQVARHEVTKLLPHPPGGWI